MTNVASCTVKGTTNDVTSSPVTVTVKLNSGTAETVSVGNDGLDVTSFVVPFTVQDATFVTSLSAGLESVNVGGTVSTLNDVELVQIGRAHV